MAIEAQSDFYNEDNETLSDSEKVKKQYDNLCEKIGKLDNHSYIDEEWNNVTLLFKSKKHSKVQKEFRDIARWMKWLIVVKQDRMWNIFITNVFCNSIRTWDASSQKAVVKHERWMNSWIQKTNGGKATGPVLGWDWWVAEVTIRPEFTGVEKFDNMDANDVSPFLSKIYGRYLDIIIPIQQDERRKKMLLDRAENDVKENDADKFLEQALEDMA